MSNYFFVKDRLLSKDMNRFHPELDSISALLAALGNPEKKLKIIHVVGTNGKGSVSNMLGGIFTSYGLKTGLFTSPYITELTEYIHVDGNEISKEHFARIAEKLFVICVKEGIYPSHFEFVTVVSILYFIEKNCDVCIYEAGLGGKTDATNVFDSSLCTVVTSLGFDHTDFLGDNISEIVKHKCGITKEGESVFSTDCILDAAGLNELGVLPDSVKEIKAFTEGRNALLSAFPEGYSPVKAEGFKLSFGTGLDIELNTEAVYQIKNALTAVRCALYVIPAAFENGEGDAKARQEKLCGAVKTGIENFSLKARYERYSKNPEIIIDGGHNPDCINEIVKSLKRSSKRELMLVTGVMKDKDYKAMYELINPFVSEYVCIDEENERALDTNSLADYLAAYGKKVVRAYSADVAAAYVKNFSEGRTILYLGTLYLSDAFRQALDKYFDPVSEERAYENAVARLTFKNFFTEHYSLEDMAVILSEMDNPQEKHKTIHVAGTNGKGSTCSMISSILTAAGYNVGLFTSPYLRVFDERIRYRERTIERNMLAALTGEILRRTEKHNMDMNQFALVTLIAFAYYDIVGADYVVLETGLGGTYDPTNIIKKPVCTAITNIGLDHTKILGKTLAEIAASKAGIIKEGVPVIAYPSDPAAMEVIIAKAREKNAKLVRISEADIDSQDELGKYNTFTYKGRKFECALRGDFQQLNAMVAAQCGMCVLTDAGVNPVSAESAVRKGLRSCNWSGRLEMLYENPLVYADGGHNPQCIESVTGYLRRAYPDHAIYVVCGFMKDKAYEEMCGIINEACEKFFLVPVRNPRSLTVPELATLQNKYKTKCTAVQDLMQAFRLAMEEETDKKKLILFTGSLYLIDEVYGLLDV